MLRPTLRVVVALGGFAWAALWPALPDGDRPARRPAFGHRVRVTTPAGLLLIGCYHPSQQNTFTGRLTPQMLDEVFADVLQAAGLAA